MESKSDLIEAIAALEELSNAPPEGRRATDRYDVRPILIGLGDAILQGGPEGAKESLVRLAPLAVKLGEEWTSACQSEMALACAEHINGVDARFLNHPKYDFKYTIRGRELLEARLIAGRELGISVSASLMRGVQAADERLAPFL